MRFAARLLLLSYSVLNLSAQEETRNPRTTQADIAAGAKTFRSHCAPCHGYNAEGGRGPNLAAGRFFHGSTDSELFHNISEGIAGTEMPGIFYSSDRVWQIVAYLRSLNTHTEKPVGDVDSGAKLFRANNCAECHSINGKGGALGPDLSSIGIARSIENLRRSITEPDADVSPRYWTVRFQDSTGKQVKGFLLNEDTYSVQLLTEDGKLCSYEKSAMRMYEIDKHSVMPSYRNSLTEAQLNDLVAFLWSLRPNE